MLTQTHTRTHYTVVTLTAAKHSHIFTQTPLYLKLTRKMFIFNLSGRTPPTHTVDTKMQTHTFPGRQRQTDRENMLTLGCS